MKKLIIRRPNYKNPTRYVTAAQKTIRKFWLRCKTMRPSNNVSDSSTPGYIRFRNKDVLCPILQDTVTIEHCFKFVTHSGHVQTFDAIALANYFKVSNNFVCPCTRQEFTRHELIRLREKLKKLGVFQEYLLMLSDFEMRVQIRRTQLENTYRSLAVENSCAALMTECLDTSSNLALTTQEAAVELVNFLLPEWLQMVEDYARVNLNDCKAMLLSDKEKLIRLQRSDLHDAHGLLHYILNAVQIKIDRLSMRRTFQESIQHLQSFDELILNFLDGRRNVNDQDRMRNSVFSPWPGAVSPWDNARGWGGSTPSNSTT